MKYRILFITIWLITGSSLSMAQEEDSNAPLFNRWSVEVNFGQNKPVRPFSEGYYSSDPTKYFNFSEVNHFDLGVRYMFSNAFGLKMDYARDQFSEQLGAGSLPFDTELNRVGIQGVMNLGHLLRFDNFTNRIGLLAHAGVQVSQFAVNTGLNNGTKEDNGGVMFGITPQVRLAKWLALTADFTVVNNVRQHLNWDGATAKPDDNLSGILYSTSVGLTAYLGKKEKHADWYTEQDKLADKLDVDVDARKRLDEIETLMNDTDRDGVPDYLDAQNNTPGGVAVDSKGRFIDANKNGTPDELEARNGKESVTTQINKILATENDLVEKGLINVFFDVNSTTPNQGSSNNLYIILHYMQNNPTAKIKLYGFADKRGDEALNKNLSTQRAQNVYDFLIANAIAASRVSIEGVGADTKFMDNSEASLTLARRVSVAIEK